jgi:hypothetical protein
MSITLSPEELESVTGDDLWPTEAELIAQRQEWQTSGPLQWGGMILRPGVRLPLREIGAAPWDCGIYALFADDGGLFYVGRAKYLSQRLLQHHRNAMYRRGPRFATFRFLEVPLCATRDVEVAHIYAMEPEGNRLYEPVQWDQHGAMVAAIRKAWRIEC